MDQYVVNEHIHEVKEPEDPGYQLLADLRAVKAIGMDSDAHCPNRVQSDVLCPESGSICVGACNQSSGVRRSAGELHVPDALRFY